MNLRLRSSYQPRGDQPAAIEQLFQGLKNGEKHQVLLGVTGSGKTFTMAKLIEQANRPTLVLAHNKTLAAQLYHEFKGFFPENAVEYFVSYYDFYQPEAYVPSADLYIDKEATINDELDKLRMSATRSLFERRDVVIVASVSCIYGLGSPDAYYGMLVMLEKGQQTSREALLRRFVDIQYERAEGLQRGTFRVRGDMIEIYPTYEDQAYRIEMWGDQIDALRQIDPLTGEVRAGQEDLSRVPIYPKTHYVMPQDQKERAIQGIYAELDWWKKELEKQGKFVEAQRVTQRTMFDIEMIRTIGYCHGIENYSRHLSGRLPGEAAHLARLRAAGFPPVHRRIASDRASGARHGSRRPFAQADAGRLRISHAVGAGQSAAYIRRVRASHESSAVRLRDARPLRTNPVRRGVCRTGNQAHRAGRSPGGDTSREGAGG
jgi:excinuclease ABC subunit B